MRKVEVAFNKGYRVDKDGVMYGLKGQVMSLSPNNHGYQQFTVWVGGAKIKTVMVHQLQAYQKFGREMFQDGIQVRHLNGDKLDNSWDNIGIGTASENMMDIPIEVRHARAVQRNRDNSKLSIGDVLEIRRLHKEGWKQVELMARFGIAKSTVSCIVRNKTWCNI